MEVVGGAWDDVGSLAEIAVAGDDNASDKG